MHVHHRNRKAANVPRCAGRSGQAIIEFAVVGIVFYLLLAAILTFGHALYVAQGLQTSVDLASREISRTPLAADDEFETVLASGALDAIYSDDYLVFDLDTLGGQTFFQDVVPTWPNVPVLFTSPFEKVYLHPIACALSSIILRSYFSAKLIIDSISHD